MKFYFRSKMILISNKKTEWSFRETGCPVLARGWFQSKFNFGCLEERVENMQFSFYVPPRKRVVLSLITR